MKQAILDSSCLRSKKLFPSNTNTNFTVQLPQRMEFQRDSTITRNWGWVIGFKDVTKLSFVYWTIDLTQEMNIELKLSLIHI